MTSSAEFHIDLDFAKNTDLIFDDDPIPEVDNGDRLVILLHYHISLQNRHTCGPFVDAAV
jgi:hypothetical protein